MIKGRITLLKLFVFITLGFLSIFICIPFYRIGDFYFYLDNYSGHISRNDQIAATEGMEQLRYFYDLNKRLLGPFGVDGFVAERIFVNATYHQSAFDYLTGRFDKVAKDLENGRGYWAYYIRGNANFRMAQGVYQSALDEKDPELKKKKMAQADEMAKLTKDDYELAVRDNLTMEASWNYDIVTNDGARGAALMPKPKKALMILGFGGKDKDGLGLEGDDGKGLNLKDKDGDRNKDSKGNPSPRRPG